MKPKAKPRQWKAWAVVVDGTDLFMERDSENEPWRYFIYKTRPSYWPAKNEYDKAVRVTITEAPDGR